MKKTILLLLIFVGIAGTSIGQNYPENLREYGFSSGVLNRFDSNADDGTSEEGFPVFRLAFDYQLRQRFLIAAWKATFESGGYYNEVFYNSSSGCGFALLRNHQIRIDCMLYAGLDISKNIGAPWIKPSLSSNINVYYKNLSVSLAGRAALGMWQGYSEGGITIGYFLRNQAFRFQKLNLNLPPDFPW